MEKVKLYGWSSSDKANKLWKGWNYSETSRYHCQCSSSGQIPIQDDINYHQFLSLYQIKQRGGQAVLIIYDTENEKEDEKAFGSRWKYLDESTSITQLPNGELFCYGSRYSGIALIIDRNYGVRKLLSGTRCGNSSALYFYNNIYCFGGYDGRKINLSRKFDLEKNKWINLTPLPEADSHCHSMIFNRNILISRYFSINLWLYSTELDSFSIIPYVFQENIRKVLINVERLYLIEWHKDGLIYESEDEYHWKPISKSGNLFNGYYQRYCLYNKEKIYISAINEDYYQFDLKTKVLHRIN